MFALTSQARSPVWMTLATVLALCVSLPLGCRAAASSPSASSTSAGSASTAPTPPDARLAALGRLTPDPVFTPTQVVQIQLAGLKLNDPTDGDRGLAIAFSFASPHHPGERQTLDRFRDAVRTPAFRALLNHQRALIEPAPIRGQRAQVTVTVIDEQGFAHGYQFHLILQQGGALDRCWLTEGVVPMPLTEGLLLV